ncbi:MAG: hypothetical protein GY926_21740 [bacterium]|nr:hypothetical protein [bacterium]
MDTASYSSEPWGDQLDASYPGTTATNAEYGWLGQHQKATETTHDNITQMGARPYHPGVARFLSVDTIEGGTLNDYAYAHDPINSYDLTGTETTTIWCTSTSYVGFFGIVLTTCSGTIDGVDFNSVSGSLAGGFSIGGSITPAETDAEHPSDLSGVSKSYDASLLFYGVTKSWSADGPTVEGGGLSVSRYKGGGTLGVGRTFVFPRAERQAADVDHGAKDVDHGAKASASSPWWAWIVGCI